MTSLRQRVVEWIPPKLAGLWDYYCRPQSRQSWGAPFNGQSARQRLFVELLNACPFSAIVETGTFRGTTTAFMAEKSTLPVYSCEVDPRMYSYVSRRLQSLRRIKLSNEDSRNFLKGLPLPNDRPLFFYLDAHWLQDLPLKTETEFIFQSFTQFVIMIDDFEVPGDAGYTFDDYGVGKTLNLRDFPFDRDPRVTVFVPNVPSEKESGSRRGCIVLVSASLADSVRKIESLRTLGPVEKTC